MQAYTLLTSTGSDADGLDHTQPTQTINGKRFSAVRDFDRVRLCYRCRHMIDGKPVARAVWEAEKVKAQAEEAASAAA